MLASTSKLVQEPAYGRKNSSIIQNSRNSSACSLNDLEARIAVRYLVKKSKRFDMLESQRQRRVQKNGMKKIALKSESPECLLYLGLAPKNGKSSDKRKRENENDFEFTIPRVYECDHCTKMFFHKLVYRRHMIRHIKKSHWCVKCNRGFTTKMAKKRHQLNCGR